MFDALLRGESAVRRIELNSIVGTLQTVGASVPGEPWSALSRSQLATSDRLSHYALVAANSAIADAALDLEGEDRTRIGTAIGTSLGGTISQEAAYADILAKGATRLSPFTLMKVMYNGPAAQVCLQHKLEGPSLTYSTTCSSSSVSIGEAMHQIRHGYADVMIAGGAESTFSYVAIKAWQAMQVLAPENKDNIAATCRPFSRNRNGTVLGDGAAILVMEEYERARARGAQMYAELSGYGVSNDSAHMTQPSVAGQSRAMHVALADAKMSPDCIDYVNAHGTGTQLNDATETTALKEVFRDHARSIAVSSTKSMHGHLIGAAGALEAAISAMALRRQCVPPTAHLDDPDPACDLDYVPHVGRNAKLRAAISNSFAVGGTAAVLVLSRLE
jgi:3-oxoacyl-[acyl-carrier-protein] synthase II